MIQMFFSLTFYYVAIPVYNGMLMLGYTTLYTSLPVFCLVFDEDVTLKNVMKFPILYKALQKGRELNTKTFLLWMWKSIYQAGIIFFLGVTVFERSFLHIVTITFTALIFAELLNVYSTIHKVNCVMVGTQVLTVVLYILSITLLSQYIDTKQYTIRFLVEDFVITLLSWGPIHFTQKCMQWCWPSEQDKIMDQP
eukprot:TRINITY_DN0_c7392_g1_i1.p1 TRINITY_DN0_c7392_g1~~TRINITY_DN0_c7392_g1_i1.p1  ORF type:complete len:195 (+),score=34.12 TRINITY_DN0_c7392_g1_i1:57-641(+)